MTKLSLLDIIRSRTEILLFNPYHEKSSGRFASRNKAAGAVSAARKHKGTAGEIAGGAVGAAGGAVVGSNVGHLVGAMIGGVAATVAYTKFGVDMETGHKISKGMADLGTVVGAGVGATRGAKAGAKAGRRAAEWVEFEDDAETLGLDGLLNTLKAFLESDKKRFAVIADQNPMFADWGFKKEGKYLYAGRDTVENLVKVIEKVK